MIHFFRRIRQKLLSENRLTRYLIYAIGEILLVVVGILIALAINNWNEDRKQRNSEYAILVDLHEEYTQNISTFESHLSRKIDVKGGIELLIETIAAPYSDSPLKTKDRGPSGANTYNPTQSAIQSVIETGMINIISNDSLRYLLTNWKDILLDFTEDEEWHINFLQSTLYAYETKHTPLHYFKTRPGDGYISPFHSAEEMKDIFFTIYEDPEYKNLLLRNHQYLDGTIRDGRKVMEMID